MAALQLEKASRIETSEGAKLRKWSLIQPEDFKQKVDQSHLQQVMDEGAVVEAAQDLIDYWGRRNVAGLLLMPATRHNFVHLNEALRIKLRRR